MAVKNYIQLINIKKVYDDGYIAVQDINISINKGEFVTLLGPSGCGKTTILKMLAGFDMPTVGQIMVDGVDIKELPINQRPTATVFQDYALFPNMNVYQNITYGLKVMRKPMRDILPKVREEGENFYRIAIKKAALEIKKIEIQQGKLLRQLVRLDELYKIYPEVTNIKNMRHAQFIMKQNYFLKKLKENYGENAEFKISRSNKQREFRYMWNRRLWQANRLIKYNMVGLNKWERLYLELKKWYLYKTTIDNRYDRVIGEYSRLDNLSSYWQNYPMTTLANFEKKNTSRKLSKEEIKHKANEIIELVGLNGNENKYPNELSGGMQQRVALARALVVEPDILLLDEPLSALDAKVRQQMQLELKRLHNELGITFILVTHDQEEALTLSTKVVVMSKGHTEQIDSPKRIYDSPRNEWVASFIGKANLFNGVYIGHNKIKFADEIFNVADSAVRRFKPDSQVKFMIRPEDIYFVEPNRGIITGRVIESIYKGQMYSVRVKWKNFIILVESTKQINSNTNVGLDWETSHIHVMLDKAQRNPNEFRF